MIASQLLVGITRLLVGAHGHWIHSRPAPTQRIYFANHTSHLDTLALWAAVPPTLRARTRPVAARDYRGGGGIRGFIAEHGFRAVYIERGRTRDNPPAPLKAALGSGDSLILFPGGGARPHRCRRRSRPASITSHGAIRRSSQWRSISTCCTARCPRAACCRCH